MEILIFVGVLVLIISICCLIEKINDSKLNKIRQDETIVNEIKAKKDLIDKEEHNLIEEYKNKLKSLDESNKQLELDLKEKKDKADNLYNYYNKLIQDFDKIISEKCQFYPQLSVIMSDLLTYYYERSAKFLEEKPHPAHNETFRIRELRQDTKKILAQKKNLNIN